MVHASCAQWFHYIICQRLQRMDTSIISILLIILFINSLFSQFKKQKKQLLCSLQIFKRKSLRLSALSTVRTAQNHLFQPPPNIGSTAWHMSYVILPVRVLSACLQDILCMHKSSEQRSYMASCVSLMLAHKPLESTCHSRGSVPFSVLKTNLGCRAISE